MNKYTLYIFALLLFACHKDKSAFEQKLIEGKWVYNPYEKVTDKVRFTEYMKLYENHQYEGFTISSNIKSSIMCSHEEPPEWYYDEPEKDLIIGEYKFRVTSVTNDTIYLQKGDKSKALLFRVRN